MKISQTLNNKQNMQHHKNNNEINGRKYAMKNTPCSKYLLLHELLIFNSFCTPRR